MYERFGVLFPSSALEYMTENQEVDPMYYVCFYETNPRYVVIKEVVHLNLEDIPKDIQIMQKNSQEYFIMAGIFNNKWELGIPPEVYIPNELDDLIVRLNFDYTGLRITQSDNVATFFWGFNRGYLYPMDFDTDEIYGRPSIATPKLIDANTN